MNFDPNQTYYLALSQATFEEIADVLEASGFDVGVIMMTEGGRAVAGVELGNVMVYSAGGADTRIHSGNLSDYEVSFSEEAFRAGYKAGADHAIEHGDTLGCDSAWDRFEPSDGIMEMQANLGGEKH